LGFQVDQRAGSVFEMGITEGEGFVETWIVLSGVFQWAPWVCD
jgi:hypothetical protein